MPVQASLLADLTLTLHILLQFFFSFGCLGKQSIPTRGKRCKNVRRPSWRDKELLRKLGVNKVFRRLKQGQVALEVYSTTAWEARDKVRKAKAQLELSLASNTKDYRKGFYRFVANKRKMRHNVGPLWKEMGAVATLDKEKEVLNKFYTSVFHGKCSSQSSPVGKSNCRNWENEDPKPSVGEDQV